MDKMCEGCGERPPKTSRSRFCGDPGCERARTRQREAKSQRKKREQAGTVAESPSGAVFAATLEELAAAGRVSSSAGQQALKLATRIDYSAKDSGASLAALGRQHLAALADALKDVPVSGDLGDELQERRRQRAAGG